MRIHTGSAFPFGLLMCLLGPGYLYKRIAYAHRVRMCLWLQLLSFCCTVGLAFVADETATTSGIVLKASLVGTPVTTVTRQARHDGNFILLLNKSVPSAAAFHPCACTRWL